MAGRSSAASGTSVPSRVFAVLDCFRHGKPTMTLTQVAAMSGIPLSTTRRLLLELTAWGGLERLADGSYRIGMRLWELGSLAPRQRDLRDAASPYMHDLYEAAEENVQLSVLDGLEVLCVEKLYGRRAVPTLTDVGERMPLHATAAGKALLAFSGPEVLRAVIDAGLPRLTGNTLVEPGRLSAALQRTRETGLSYSFEERTLGVVSVGSPMISPNGRLLGAISIIARVGTRIDRLAPAVRTAALTISRAIA
jgi:DNA-binding IclR family transcriptional regulator